MDNIVKVVLILIGIAALLLVIPFLIMLIWNWIVPSIFGLRMISFKEAFLLLILARLILPVTYSSKK